jgi:hypothetical protein
MRVMTNPTSTIPLTLLAESEPGGVADRGHVVYLPDFENRKMVTKILR